MNYRGNQFYEQETQSASEERGRRDGDLAICMSLWYSFELNLKILQRPVRSRAIREYLVYTRERAFFMQGFCSDLFPVLETFFSG